MKTPLSSNAGQVHNCLELATMGFQREDAVKMVNGRLVPLTPTDICERTDLSKQDVRRALEELEELGLAERRAIKGEGLTKGNVALYSWAVPRAPKNDLVARAATISDFAAVFSEVCGLVSPKELEALISFIRRNKIHFEPGLVVAREPFLEAVAAVARYQAAVDEARALLEGIIAPSRIHKEESNGKELIERNPPPASQPISEDVAHPVSLPKPAGRLVVEVPEEIPETQNPADEVRAYLESIPRPGLTPQIVEEVAKHITTPEALEAFKVETMPAKVERGQTWKYFVAIAQRVGLDAPRYAVAKANGGNGHSPPEPKSRSQLRAEAFAREIAAQEKARGR